MKVTLYDGLTVTPPRACIDVTLAELAAAILPHRVVPQKDLMPGYSLAELAPGATRSNAAVIAVHGAMLDFDEMSADDVATVTRVLAPYGHILATSHSHGIKPGGARFRAIIPFTGPIPPERWKDVYAGLQVLFEGLIDEVACSKVSQFYYLPSCPDPALALSYWQDGPGLDPDTLPSGRRPFDREGLKRVLKGWQRKREPLAEPLAKLVKGEPYANLGERDTMCYQLLSALYQDFPAATDKEIQDLFFVSHQLMGDDAPNALEKWGRIKRKVGQEIVDPDRSYRIAQAFLPAGQADPYTQEQLDSLQAKYGPRPKAWLLQWRKTFEILGPYGYVKCTQDDALAVARTYLSPAPLSLLNPDGKDKTTQQLMKDYGSPIASYLVDMSAQDSRYDHASKAFVRATCPVRLTANYEPLCEEFLTILGADGNVLRGWLSILPNLKKRLVILHLSGPPSTGKSLFALSAAMIWGRATPAADAFGPWNHPTTHNPLVHAAEEDGLQNVKASELRAFIDDETWTSRQKFCDPVTVIGLRRLVVTTNDHDKTFQDEGEDAMLATAMRYRHIRFGGNETPEAKAIAAACIAFYERPGVAEHMAAGAWGRYALHLAANHKIQPHRFGIEPDKQLVEDMKIRGNHVRPQILQWIVEFMNRPDVAFLVKNVKIEKDIVLVQTSAFLAVKDGRSNWNLFLTSRAPTPRILREAVASLGPRVHRHEAQWYAVPFEALRAWCEHNGWPLPGPLKGEPVANNVVRGPWGNPAGA